MMDLLLIAVAAATVNNFVLVRLLGLSPVLDPDASLEEFPTMAVATTVSDVCFARTFSSSFITLAGEKKCRPTTSCGRLVTEAISLM